MTAQRVGNGWIKWVDAEGIEGYGWHRTMFSDLPVKETHGEVFLILDAPIPYIVIIHEKDKGKFVATRVPSVLILDNQIEGTKAPLREAR